MESSEWGVGSCQHLATEWTDGWIVDDTSSTTNLIHLKKKIRVPEFVLLVLVETDCTEDSTNLLGWMGRMAPVIGVMY